MTHDYDLDRLRSEMNGAWEAMQYMKAELDKAWSEVESTQSRYGHLIEELTRDHDRAFDDMKRAYDRASDAFTSGVHDDAASYSAEGRNLRDSLSGYVSERRQYIDECKSAQSHHKGILDAYRDKKHEFRLAKERFDDRKAQLEGARRDLAIRAGDPSYYGDEVIAKNEPGGKTSVYFGGVGSPDGPGHAHYVIDEFGNLTWRREPHESRGRHNAR